MTSGLGGLEKPRLRVALVMRRNVMVVMHHAHMVAVMMMHHRSGLDHTGGQGQKRGSGRDEGEFAHENAPGFGSGLIAGCHGEIP